VRDDAPELVSMSVREIRLTKTRVPSMSSSDGGHGLAELAITQQGQAVAAVP
jgi:hypothetical protein